MIELLKWLSVDNNMGAAIFALVVLCVFIYAVIDRICDGRSE